MLRCCVLFLLSSIYNVNLLVSGRTVASIIVNCYPVLVSDSKITFLVEQQQPCLAFLPPPPNEVGKGGYFVMFFNLELFSVDKDKDVVFNTIRPNY